MTSINNGKITITKPNYLECYINTKPLDTFIVFNSKLFHNDICDYSNNIISNIISKRDTFLIGGVLKLSSNIYFKENNKFLYEFIPLNWRYPKFMVPSSIKQNLIKRKEDITDYFVVIEFKDWKNKFPNGSIKLSIGPIHNLHNQYEILLYYYPEHPFVGKSKINYDISVKIEKYAIAPVSEVYSIDPIGCKDIDDALSYDEVNNKIGIHIADVLYTIDTLNYYNYSTVYAPHKIINMLPDDVTYNYCSLLQGTVKPVISCYIHIDTFNIQLIREFVSIKRNYSYDDIEQLNINSINKIMEFAKKLNKRYNFLEFITDSHHMVELYMIFLNAYIAELLKDEKIIYRNQEPQQFSEYSFESKGHFSMKLKNYTHFTSPIRRYVDQYVHQVLINKVFKQPININQVSIEDINTYEKQLKKITNAWNHILTSTKINNGSLYTLEFIQFDSNHVEFKLLDYNIIINNKLFFDIINDTTIKINENVYEITNNYILALYIMHDLKNYYFPKIMIKF